MLTWDKIYTYIKDLLNFKKNSAQSLWSIAEAMTEPSIKLAFLELWRQEILHTISLNKLLQSLGYTQIKLMDKTVLNYSNISKVIEENIAGREKWLPILEKVTEETFGNDIYYTFMEIMVDDLINIEVLKELKNKNQFTTV